MTERICSTRGCSKEIYNDCNVSCRSCSQNSDITQVIFREDWSDSPDFWLENSTCPKCNKHNVSCIAADNSDEEYAPVFYCLACLKVALDGPVTKEIT